MFDPLTGTPQKQSRGQIWDKFGVRGFFCPAAPEGPFRTKNATALDSVVFWYRLSFLLSVLFSCHFFPRKTSISEHSPYRFATAVANLLPVLNLLSVLF